MRSLADRLHDAHAGHIAEVYDNPAYIDNADDCDAATDENNLPPPLNPNQIGVCAGSLQICAGVDAWMVGDVALAGSLATLQDRR